jgi:asparagine synthase (glutamine-hydrolysing)
MLKVSQRNQKPEMTEYWSATPIAQQNHKLSFASDSEAIDSLDELLRSSVKQQMIADVPIGSFLSGGIDSSVTTSLMQEQSMEKIKTFTIGFDQKGFNEAEHAKAVAKHLNTDHAELYIDSQDLLNVIPRLSELYDEPFGDSSQIPTYLISKFAKQTVTVALSGDGGDELFCGYNRYKITDKYWKKLKIIPPFLRRILANSILKISPQQIDKMYSLFSRNAQYANFSDKVLKGSNVIASQDIADLYVGLISACNDPNSLVIDGIESNKFLHSKLSTLRNLDDLSLMMLMDLLTYLPDDILTKVDRAAMGVSLETRVPMLNHQIVEFAMQLPQEYKLRDNQTKWLLREVLYRRVPKELIDRPKAGFAIPIGFWLRTSLKDWADDLLSESSIHEQGFFHAVKIRERWQQHLSGTHNWEHFLWNILMFQSWHKNFHE